MSDNLSAKKTQKLVDNLVVVGIGAVGIYAAYYWSIGVYKDVADIALRKGGELAVQYLPDRQQLRQWWLFLQPSNVLLPDARWVDNIIPYGSELMSTAIILSMAATEVNIYGLRRGLVATAMETVAFGLAAMCRKLSGGMWGVGLATVLGFDAVISDLINNNNLQESRRLFSNTFTIILGILAIQGGFDVLYDNFLQALPQPKPLALPDRPSSNENTTRSDVLPPAQLDYIRRILYVIFWLSYYSNSYEQTLFNLHKLIWFSIEGNKSCFISNEATLDILFNVTGERAFKSKLSLSTGINLIFEDPTKDLWFEYANSDDIENNFRSALNIAEALKILTPTNVLPPPNQASQMASPQQIAAIRF